MFFPTRLFKYQTSSFNFTFKQRIRNIGASQFQCHSRLDDGSLEPYMSQ